MKRGMRKKRKSRIKRESGCKGRGDITVGRG
jgi:hypothetical protein